MNKLIEIISNIDSPAWIKDKLDNIIFVNKQLEEEFKGYTLEQIDKNISTTSLDNEIIIDDNKYIQTVSRYGENDIGILNKVVVKNKSNNDLSRDILETVIDNIPELIFYKDKDLKYRVINEECKIFYEERNVYDIIGKTDLDFDLDKMFIEKCREHDNEVIKNKKTLYIDEKIPIEDTDEYAIMETIKTPIINNSGDVVGLVGVVRDVTKQKKLEEKLRYLSYTDTLTNLYNRAYFDEKVEQLIRDEVYPIGIIIGDVNGLKIVNDTLGHIEGDKLIVSMAKILNKAGLKKSFTFRWGGDEFITIIPSTSNKECIDFMEEVNYLCGKQEFENFKLSISQGHSLLNKYDDIDNIIKEAEDRVYRQKIIDSKSIKTSVLEILRENLSTKNIETKDHTDRVIKYCKDVANELNLESGIVSKLILLGKFHDIGKVGIPEEILLKKGKLTYEEYEIIKTHSEKGYRLALLLPEFSHISRDILTHHERWDGSGYPLGLKGEEIPITSRILSIVDSYDAMTNDRVYSKARDKKEAINEIRKCSGKQFDPYISEIFCKMISGK